MIRKAVLATLAVGLLALLAWGGSGVTSKTDAVTLSCSLPAGVNAEAEAVMASGAKCYLVGIDRFTGGCGGCDLFVLRYLCYQPGRGWYYVNYWYCSGTNNGGELDPGGWTSMYSFKGSTCSATNYIDPVTVVFKGATAKQVEDHAADHGDWDYHSGSNQRMFSYGYCYQDDGHSNSEPDEGFLQGEQYHMRLWDARDFNGKRMCMDKQYVLATPHHEFMGEYQLGCGTSGHSVYDNLTHPPGGFNGARDDIIKNWVQHGPHDLLEWQYWGNDQVFKQSQGYGWLNGCWYAGADGRVAVIGIWH